jgi:hypothetical protein
MGQVTAGTMARKVTGASSQPLTSFTRAGLVHGGKAALAMEAANEAGG